MRTLVEAAVPPSGRHRAAVSSSLGWAQESADADALLWIHVLEAAGEHIPPAYQAKRLVWNRQMIAHSTRWGPS
jgi:hypothetical protein